MRKSIEAENWVAAAAVGLAMTLLGSPARAATITYVLPDVGTFGGFTDTDLTHTFGGTGFVGIYTGFENDFPTVEPAFVHIFGLEIYNLNTPNGIYSETELQVDVSALLGTTINSATLSYYLQCPCQIPGGSQTVTATSYSTSGTLSYNTSPPDDLGSVSFISMGNSANSVDVTSLLQARLASNASWFGLYLTPMGSGQFQQATFTGAGFEDAALVRLTVNYTTVPEPASIALLASGLLALVRRRSSRT